MALNRSPQTRARQSRSGERSYVGRDRKAYAQSRETDQQHEEIEQSWSALAQGRHCERLS